MLETYIVELDSVEKKVVSLICNAETKGNIVKVKTNRNMKLSFFFGLAF